MDAFDGILDLRLKLPGDGTEELEREVKTLRCAPMKSFQLFVKRGQGRGDIRRRINGEKEPFPPKLSDRRHARTQAAKRFQGKEKERRGVG